MAVSDGFFQILGVQPIIGRWFTRDEDTPGKDQRGDHQRRLWRRRMEPTRTFWGEGAIQINTRDFVIVGVMPATFRFPQTKAELWQPLAIDRAVTIPAGISRPSPVFARARRSGAAQADMNRMSARFKRSGPISTASGASPWSGCANRRWRRAYSAADVAGRGGAGAADRVCERSQSDADARRRARTGNRHALRAGRQADPDPRQLLVESSLFA